MNKETFRMIARIQGLGIAESDAWELRRIAMALHSWGERECGNGYGCIERDEATGRPLWRYSSGKSGGYIRDMERGALRRLGKIMVRYPDLSVYHQTDPRGASLYVMHRDDVKNVPVDQHYTRGVAVFK